VIHVARNSRETGLEHQYADLGPIDRFAAYHRSRHVSSLDTDVRATTLGPQLHAIPMRACSITGIE
jgi:hypothetical protein